MSQHFWLLCGVWCGLGNGALIWFRRKRYVEAGLLSEEEVLSFARGTVLWLLVPCLLLWALQLSAGGDPSPEYWRWPLPQRCIAFALQAFVWLALAYWVFIRDGANTLSAYFGTGSKAPAFLHSPLAVKVGTIAVLVSGIVALLSAHA
jgi:hypothetical protein